MTHAEALSLLVALFPPIAAEIQHRIDHGESTRPYWSRYFDPAGRFPIAVIRAVRLLERAREGTPFDPIELRQAVRIFWMQRGVSPHAAAALFDLGGRAAVEAYSIVLRRARQMARSWAGVIEPTPPRLWFLEVRT